MSASTLSIDEKRMTRAEKLKKEDPTQRNGKKLNATRLSLHRIRDRKKKIETERKY